MSEITKKEEGTFLMLFNRNGYVLNFSTADFDVFTTNSIGVALCNKYGLPTVSYTHLTLPTKA